MQERGRLASMPNESCAVVSCAPGDSLAVAEVNHLPLARGRQQHKGSTTGSGSQRDRVTSQPIDLLTYIVSTGPLASSALQSPQTKLEKQATAT